MPSHSKQATDDLAQIMLLLAARLFQGAPVDARYIRDRFNVSRPTADRYMHRLECSLPVQTEERVHKGRVLTLDRACRRRSDTGMTPLNASEFCPS